MIIGILGQMGLSPLSFWNLFLSVKLFYIHLPKIFTLNFKLLRLYPEYMLGASKRNLLSANYATLVKTEATVETGGRQEPRGRRRAGIWPRAP